MDPVRAKRMAEELVNQHVGRWHIRRYRNAGRTAIVFEAEKDGRQCTLKLFDPEFVERAGKPIQLERIKRELRLIGEHHPHLVQIFDGGECAESGYLYVVMELIEAPNLGSALTLIPREKIAFLLHQIASAARFLEEKQLAHRDIKPDNIAVFPDFSKAVLLDLGVLRPFGDPGLTDDEARIFVGTTRYSPPEFLLRNEKDTPDGWRAITFYQLGGVLHDLIMRRPLFKEFSEPPALLLKAVESIQPEICADDVSPDLVLLAQNCLVKAPEARLTLVSWNNFDPSSGTQRSSASARERVKSRALLACAQSGEEPPPPQLTARQISQRIVDRLDTIIRFECLGNDSFPPMELIPNTEGQIQVCVTFSASLRHMLPQPLSMRFDCELVDSATMAVTIAASASLLPGSASHGNPPAPAIAFRGPLDSNNLADRIQDVLWLAIDLAQLQDAPSTSGGDARWLNLIQGLEGQP